MSGFGTFYALRKLKSILNLFKKENLLMRLHKHITGEDDEVLRKEVRASIDKKVDKIVQEIRVRQ